MMTRFVALLIVTLIMGVVGLWAAHDERKNRDKKDK